MRLRARSRAITSRWLVTRELLWSRKKRVVKKGGQFLAALFFVTQFCLNEGAGGGAAHGWFDPIEAVPVEGPPLAGLGPEFLPKPVVEAAAETGGVVATTTGRDVCVMVFATRSRWRTDPRGTPKPAEPGLMVRRCGAPMAGFAVRPSPTSTVRCPLTGGVGTFVLTGGFTTRGIPLNEFQ